ncbi:MAG: hypothetical protein U1E10_10295 [Bdellovibrionales bacterium]|nr:hypothetical protein [Bdellovibrionales bacterium]
MKITIFLLSIFIFTEKYCLAETMSYSFPGREVQFDQKVLFACETQKDIELCLYKSLGKEIGFSTKEGKLISVNFPKLRGGTFIVNGTTFKKAFNPSIKFNRKLNSYSVCGTQGPIEVGQYQIKGMGSCICGFTEKGVFALNMDDGYPFVPKTLKISANSVACNSDMKSFDSGSITLLEKAKICGYDFPKNTEFYKIEGGIAFKAPKDGAIDGKGGVTLSLNKGVEYMADVTLDRPCNWEPVPTSSEED